MNCNKRYAKLFWLVFKYHARSAPFFATEPFVSSRTAIISVRRIGIFLCSYAALAFDFSRRPGYRPHRICVAVAARDGARAIQLISKQCPRIVSSTGAYLCKSPRLLSCTCTWPSCLSDFERESSRALESDRQYYLQLRVMREER